MSKELSLFGNLPVSAELLAKAQGLNDKLAGGGGGQYKRISIKGSKFRMIEGGEQVSVSKSDSMEIIVVGASPVVRQYFEGSYDPAATAVPPVCWSDDSNTHKPSVNVDEPQASSCKDCPQNIKGSGTGQSRACRYSQRLAVLLPGELDQVYQMSLPATSLFGEAERGMYPMQGYARLLRSHKTPITAIVTEMIFDEDSEVPKLFFKPVRALEEDELETVLEVAESQEVTDAITLTVSQADGVQVIATDEEQPKAKAKAKAKKKAKAAAEEADEDDDEPKKVSKKKPAPEPEVDTKLASLVSEWDDDDDDDDDED